MEQRDYERRLRSFEESLREHNRRIADVEESVNRLLAEIKPVLAEISYANRRRAEREVADRRRWLRTRWLVGLLLGVPVCVETLIQLAHSLGG